MELQDGKYYWVKPNKHDDWCIAEYSLPWDNFHLSKGRKIVKRFIFEIDPTPIERK